MEGSCRTAPCGCGVLPEDGPLPRRLLLKLMPMAGCYAELWSNNLLASRAERGGIRPSPAERVACLAAAWPEPWWYL